MAALRSLVWHPHWATLMHLALWAQIGVLTRSFLDQFFVLGCKGGWGPCLEGESRGRAWAGAC